MNEKKSKDLEQKLLQKDPDRIESIYTSENADIPLNAPTLLGRAFFLGADKVIRAGLKKTFQFNMLFKIEEFLLYKEYPNFKKLYEELKPKYKEDLFAILRAYVKRYLIAANICLFIRYSMELAFPLLLKLMLEWVGDEEAEDYLGYVYAGGLSLALGIKSYTNILSGYFADYANAKIRSGIKAHLINKVSSVAPGVKKYIDIAKISNNMSVDVDKITFYIVFRPNLFYVPIIILAYLSLIIYEVGLIGVASFGVIFVGLFFQSYFDRSFRKVNFRRMGISDKRGKKINEIITGIKIVKFNAWEKLMNNMTQKYRILEGKLILKGFLLYNFSQAISSFIPTVLGLVIFSLYEVINGEKLKVAQIYELITLFNGLLMPIQYYIMSMMGRAEAMAACDRINAIIQVDNYEPLVDDHKLKKGEIQIENGCFNWDDPKYYKLFEKKEMSKEKADTYILRDVNVKINQGEFVAVVGKVGSGKSSLLLALMNEMVKRKGEVTKNGRIAYISQEAFLQNATIKENITFGTRFDQEKFNNVLKICQMETDLEILPGREETEIGERGINMSGGQKQRVNIARAVYSDSDIYLIDDALSALDAYVGKKVMDEVFKGDLGDKTRVMVTHYLHLLDQVDKVILIDGGEIKAYGTYEEVKDLEVFQNFAQTLGEDEEKKKSLIEEENEHLKQNMIIEDIIEKESSEEEIIGKELSDDDDILFKKESILIEANSKMIDTKLEKKKEDDERKLAGKLTKKEKRHTGGIGLGGFGYYFSRAGIGLSVFVFTFYFLVIASKLACDWWVGQWVNDSFKEYNLSDNDYFLIYAFTGASAFIFAIFRAFGMGYLAQRPAVQIFKSVVWNVLRRPMSFFDTTPSGVIINRCTSDVGELDYTIPFFLGFFSNIFFNFIGVFALTAFVSPITIVFIVMAFVLVAKSFNKYMTTAVEIKRMIQLGNSPIISITSEFINGATIIRNYGKSHKMLEKFEVKADLYHSTYFHNQRVNIWMRAKIEYLLALVVTCTVFTIVINKQYQLMTLTDASTSGLVISYILPLSSMTGALFFPLIILAKSAVSIERLKDYLNNKIFEKKFTSPVTETDWPRKGEIEVENLSVRYRKDLPLVLNGINFKINTGEKVAIVGRTGSGKSTTLLTLMRILEMSKDPNTGTPVGNIKIDGVRIDSIGLHELRKKISIIPQEPFLFEGTLKSNIDPHGEFEAEEIVRVLNAVQVLDTIRPEDIINQRIKIMKEEQKKKLKMMSKKQKKELKKKFKNDDDFIKSTIKIDQDPEILRIKSQGVTDMDKLKYEIEVNGSNLSIGQRQLVCIARAIIGNPKILLMDEATANIDQKTDSIIQNVIKKQLDGTTVLTIAHRLITIIQYDRLLIFENGRKIEEGSPLQLINQGGYFCNLVEEGGEEFKQKMIMAAEDRSLDPASLFS